MMVYRKVRSFYMRDQLPFLWAALFHDTGKAYVYDAETGSMRGHEDVSCEIAEEWMGQRGLPVFLIRQVSWICKRHMGTLHHLHDMSESKLKARLEEMEALRLHPLDCFKFGQADKMSNAYGRYRVHNAQEAYLAFLERLECF